MNQILLPRNPIASSWKDRPGDKTALLVTADWLDDEGKAGGDLIRKLVRLWDARLPPTVVWTKKAASDAIASVPPELCAAAAAGIVCRCAKWLGDRFLPVMAGVVQDVTEEPDEDAEWGRGVEDPDEPVIEPFFNTGFLASRGMRLTSTGGKLGRRSTLAGRAVAEAMKGVNEADVLSRTSGDPVPLWRASALSYATCAASRISRMRIWRGQPRTGAMRQALHPADLLASAMREAAVSRRMADGVRRGFLRHRVQDREQHWQLTFVAGVCLAAGVNLPYPLKKLDVTGRVIPRLKELLE